MNWENEIRKISNIKNKAVTKGNELLAKRCSSLIKRYQSGERTEGLYTQMLEVKYD